MKCYIKYFVFLFFVCFVATVNVNAVPPSCLYYVETSESEYIDLRILYEKNAEDLFAQWAVVSSNKFDNSTISFSNEYCTDRADGDMEVGGESGSICNSSLAALKYIDDIKNCPEVVYMKPTVLDNKYLFVFSNDDLANDEEYIKLDFYQAVDDHNNIVKEYEKIGYSAGGFLTGFDFCQEGTLKVFEIIGIAIIIIKVLIPLLLIIFGTIDLSKAIVANDNKAINNSINMLVKRTIAGIVIFFIPAVLSFILGLLNNISDINNNDFKKCTKCMLDISKCTP